MKEINIKRIIKKSSFKVFLFTLIVVIISCATGNNTVKGTHDFAEKNLSTFITGELDNGIPVVIKKNESNRVFTLKVGLKGHVMFTPEEMAGIEAITLAMLAKGTENYQYEAIQKLMYEKSSSISTSYKSFDHTSFDLFTLDKYYDELFPVFADCILNPTFNEDEFNRIIEEFKINLQTGLNEPYTRTVTKLHERFFEGHPYLATWEGTEESLSNITLDDVKEYYSRLFVKERMFIVAVGNFNGDELLESLNSAFGNLGNLDKDLPEVPAFKPLDGPEIILEKFDASEGLGFVRADYSIPGSSHKDYPAIVLTLSMLDDLLFEIVRIRNGAGYSMWAYPYAFKENYASIVIYKTTVPEEVKEYIDNAIAVLLSGQSLSASVSVSSEDSGSTVLGDTGDFVDIEETLEFYKAQYINKYYESQQTNSSIASQIAGSIVYAGDYKDYLFLINKINNVKKEDIIRVIKKYLYEEPKMWIVLGSEDLINKVNEEDFLNFLGNTGE